MQHSSHTTAAVIGLVGVFLANTAHAADLPLKAPPLKANCYATFWSWFNASPADCPLGISAIAFYGTIDVGGSYQTHAAPFNNYYPNGVEALVGRQVLIVDDDVRNIFALSSVLERRGMTVLTAGTGREAIETIEKTPELGIVLMDIMMPEMDGYETMQVIRQNPRFQRLPIIALTAKAMKGDREKCLEAGASEYLAKPVNTEQLLSALRMWLHR